MCVCLHEYVHSMHTYVSDFRFYAVQTKKKIFVCVIFSKKEPTQKLYSSGCYCEIKKYEYSNEMSMGK